MERRNARVGFEQARHAVPLEGDAGKFGERLDDVEIAQRRHFEKCHVVFGSVMFGQCLAHLTLVSEVESIADQNFWDAGSMLIDLIFRKDPKGFPIKKFVSKKRRSIIGGIRGEL